MRGYRRRLCDGGGELFFIFCESERLTLELAQRLATSFAARTSKRTRDPHSGPTLKSCSRLLGRTPDLVSLRDQLFEVAHPGKDISAIVMSGRVQVAVSLLLPGNGSFYPTIVAAGSDLQMILRI